MNMYGRISQQKRFLIKYKDVKIKKIRTRLKLKSE
jgi:hypothetical protein